MTTDPILLHELLDERAALTPDAPALSRDDRTWTWRDLARWSAACADWLHELGVRRGERVVLLGRNEAHVVALLFAASRLGAVFVLLSDQIRPYHLTHILSDCAPSAVIGNDEAAEIVEDVPVHRFADAPETGADPVPSGARPCLSVDPVCLIYTSGSTALPKAVVCPHRQVLFAVRAIHDRLGYRADDTVFCCLPLSFDYGLYQLFLCCVSGARLVLGDERDAGPALLGRLAEHRVTVLPLVPSLAATFCRLVRRCARGTQALRMVTNTGAELTPARCAQLRAAVPGLVVVAMFGLTECKRVSIAEPDIDLVRPGSVGRPLPDTEVSIVDDDGRPVPPGEPGELVVRGPHVMAGYWNAPEQTARRYRTDATGRAALFTGDRCRVDADGYLYFVGRGDDMFKQRGYRVSTIEIEAAALDIPGVELAAALRPDERYGSRLAVCGAISQTQLEAELRERIEDPKLPAECRVLAALPLSVNGKIDKRALAREWAGAPAEVPA